MIEKVTRADGGESWWFYCEPCKTHHRFTTKLGSEEQAEYEAHHGKGKRAPCWTFNGDPENPTFSPSLHYLGWRNPKTGELVGKCHLFLREGKIQYLSDCSHELAGKTVPVSGPRFG